MCHLNIKCIMHEHSTTFDCTSVIYFFFFFFLSVWLISSPDFIFSTAEYKTAVQTFGNPAENLQKEPSRCCSRVLTFSSSYASMWPNLEELSKSTSPAPSQTWFFGLVSRFVCVCKWGCGWGCAMAGVQNSCRAATEMLNFSQVVNRTASLRSQGDPTTSKHQVSCIAKSYSWFVQWQAHPTAHC